MVPKVSDWGLARMMLDETNSVAGLSPQYAAPEQFDSDGSVEILRDLHFRRIIPRDEVPPEVADSPFY
jgi:hypothetical protein